MLEAPSKADSMVVHDVSPHWSIDISLAASGWSPSEMAWRPPWTETGYVPGFAYLWVAAPETSVLLVPSPQWMVMPEPTSGMVMVWLAVSVCQEVTNESWSSACRASVTPPKTTSTVRRLLPSSKTEPPVAEMVTV